jgi:hypothetical protein
MPDAAFQQVNIDGLALYKDPVTELEDADAKINFTQRINDLFDLLDATYLWMEFGAT